MASTDIALRRATMPEKISYAEHLAHAGLLPDVYRRQPANVLYAIEYGEAIGIGTMAAITGVHIIKGKPSASASLIGALVRRAGHRLRVTGNDRQAVAVIIRSDDPDFEYRSEWTLERAVTAKLCALKDGRPYARDTKGDPTSWEKYPAAMLKARAITEVARDACEEVLFGLHYTPEELGASVDAEGLPTMVEQQSESSAPKSQRARPNGPHVDEWSTPAPDAVPAADDGIVDAEIVEEPAPEQPAEPQAEAATSPKANAALLKAVNVALGKHGFSGDARFPKLAELVSRPIASSSDLTVDEARGVLAALAKQAEDEAAAGPPADWTAEKAEQLAADFLIELQGARTDEQRVEIGGRIGAAVKARKITKEDRETLLAAYNDSQTSRKQPVGAGA